MLEELNDEIASCGAKAAMVYKIDQFINKLESIAIPKSYIVPSKYYKDICRINSRDEKVELIKSRLLPQIRMCFGETPLVIRSSATCEDSILFSGAGVYESFLNLKSDDEIVNAIIKIYESFEMPNANFYAKFNNIDYDKESMAILVQELAPVNVSGVLFTRNPVNNAEQLVVEWHSGFGDTVVSGNSNVNHKEIEYNAIDSEKESIIKKLFDFAMCFQQFLGYPIDIEWGYNEKILYIFQVRPICFSKQHRQITASQCIDKKIISKGLGIGQIKEIENGNSNHLILRAKNSTINDILMLIHSRGYIIKEGGVLSHFSNILREFSVPCIYSEIPEVDTDEFYILDAYRNALRGLSSLTSSEANEYLLEFIEEIYSLKNIFPFRFKQIIKVEKNEKYEAVIFNINENLHSYLKTDEQSIKLQKIWTYDFASNPIFGEKTIIRIQEENYKCRIQIKSIEHYKWYRKEIEYILNVKTRLEAEEFLKSIGLVHTGYQERKIYSRCYKQATINYIVWPKGNAYVGIEAIIPDMLSKCLSNFGYNIGTIESVDGKNIFDKFGLSITNCSFGGK